MIKRNKYFPLLFLLLTGLLFSGGCNKEKQSSPAPTTHHVKTKSNTPPVQNQQSSVSDSVTPSSSLEFANRKDPFKPFVIAEKSGKPFSSVKSADLLPIQTYETSKFKVVGIVVGLKENRALVIDPAGKGYVVKPGMLIGDSDGKITKITATTIDVVEKYRDETGRIKSRTVKLTLPQKK
jgi:type IV pilus assembly protein PilP